MTSALAPDALGPTICVGEILVEIVATTVGPGFYAPPICSCLRARNWSVRLASMANTPRSAASSIVVRRRSC